MSVRLDEARRRWGSVFSDFSLACEWVNSAWYEVENKQALKDEEIRRLDAISKQVQKAKDAWEMREVPSGK